MSIEVNMRLIKPDGGKPPKLSYYDTQIFLGGSIEMGKAIDWQSKVSESLKDLDVVVANPRRDDWDSTWVQDPTEGTQFHNQVKWELDQQMISGIIIYNFVAGTMSPITLLELGLFCGMTGTMILVCCPKDYWRYGNVVMTLDWIDRPDQILYEDLDVLIEELPLKIKEIENRKKTR